MNCKPGDLAIVVRCHVGVNNGRIVRVLAPSQGRARPDAPAWAVEPEGSRPLIGFIADGVIGPLARPRAYDDELRPLRADEGPDESLAWLPPVPSQEPSHA